jgi:hypothetical protein
VDKSLAISIGTEQVCIGANWCYIKSIASCAPIAGAKGRAVVREIMAADNSLLDKNT